MSSFFLKISLFHLFVCVILFVFVVSAVFFFQLFALWDVKAGEGGKELYGDDYADIWAIQRLHFKAAMNNDCDHVSRSEIGSRSSFEDMWRW